MGGNEYGLVIGNEAVFTKEAKGSDSLLGMDMLRLALERCKTSREAVDFLIHLLQEYGQGGNCGFEKKFTYHNAFLIADRETAWVLETAGEYWAALQVKEVYSISNRLSLGREFDLAHPRLIEHAIEKGWCKSEEDFDFARCYSEPVFTHFSGSKKRRRCSLDRLQETKGRITVETMLEILRSHTPAFDKKPYRRSSVSSVCMHAGFLFGDQTTGSYVVKLGQGLDAYWITGGSPACLGLFKPFFMVEGEGFSHGPEQAEEAESAWERREEIHRLVLENRIAADEYKRDRDLLETKWLQEVDRLDLASAPDQELADLVNRALKEEGDLLDQYMAGAGNKKARIRGNPYFRSYWKKTIKALRTGKR